MGDPAGIGIEIAAKAWRMRANRHVPPFVLYGDPAAVVALARRAETPVEIEVVAAPDDAASVFAHRLPVRPVLLAEAPVAGRPAVANAPGIIQAIEDAVADVRHGLAAALVTNPIAKSVLTEAGFAHPGHTEFLALLAARHWPGTAPRAVMMLASAELRVVPLTVHIPLADVPSAITHQLIVDTVTITWRALVQDFAIPAPRIVVAGLNPHAGEAGTMGDEEEAIIAPAIAALGAEGIAVTGPYPADTLFHAARRKDYDAAVCMYHDQALIPLKTLAFDTGVNVTLGLPFVRTSPDHGTAFDIAGTGRASCDSLVAALQLAAAIAEARRRSQV